MNKLYKLSSMLLVAAFVLLLAGCNHDTNNQAPDVRQPTETEPPGGRTDSEDEVTAADRFNGLADEGAPVSELLSFLIENRDETSAEQLTAMLDTFERKQHEQAAALEDRFYHEAAVQEKLLDWYAEHRALPGIEEVEDEAVQQLLSETAAGGYKLETAEGMFFPVIDYERYREFQPFVTEDMNAYIEIMAVESNTPAIKDAALVIPWEEVVARALAMEAFLRDYPQSVKSDSVDQLFRGYQYITFRGIDNSPIFENEGGGMLPEVRSAFADAIGRGAGTSEYLADVTMFMERLGQHDYKQTEEVRELQEQLSEGLLEEFEG